MSRARLGLYIFARVTNFENCYELSPSFKLLLGRPQHLHVLPDEEYPTQRTIDAPLGSKPEVLTNTEDMVKFVYQFYQRKVEQWQVEKPEIFEKLQPEETVEDSEESTPNAGAASGDKPMEVVDEEDDAGFEKLTEDDTGLQDEEIEFSEGEENA